MGYGSGDYELVFLVLSDNNLFLFHSKIAFRRLVWKHPMNPQSKVGVKT